MISGSAYSGCDASVCSTCPTYIQLPKYMKHKHEYKKKIIILDYEGIAKEPVETSHYIFDF